MFINKSLSIFLWFEYDYDMNWMNDKLRNYWEIIENWCDIWSCGFEQILGVFSTGSEELFSPFLAGTLPDFL